MLTGMYFIWSGWLCKVNELIQGRYRITCLDWTGQAWLAPAEILDLLGMAPLP